jgi:hypothetical protein
MSFLVLDNPLFFTFLVLFHSFSFLESFLLTFLDVIPFHFISFGNNRESVAQSGRNSGGLAVWDEKIESKYATTVLSHSNSRRRKYRRSVGFAGGSKRLMCDDHGAARTRQFCRYYKT